MAYIIYIRLVHSVIYGLFRCIAHAFHIFTYPDTTNCVTHVLNTFDTGNKAMDSSINYPTDLHM